MVRHGSSSGYSYHGCRCDVCVSAKRARDRDYYERTRGDRQRKVVLTPEERSKRNVERVAAWKKANPDRAKAANARNREKSREKRRADSLARYHHLMETDPERVRKQRREWKRSERGRAYQRLANHRRRQAPMGPEVLEWWMSLDDPACAYCGSPATEIDHVVPVSRGGTSELSNLVPSCRKCNASKNDRTAQEYLALKGA